MGTQLELFAPAPPRVRPRVGITFAALQSGSSGNATLVAAGKTCLLIDCGLSPARLSERLAEHGRTIADLSGVLVTHEHTDHAGGTGALARRFGVPLHMNEPTANAAAERILRKEKERAWVRFLPASGVLAWKDGQAVDPSEPHDLRASWLPVPHDAASPVAFVVEREHVRVGVFTDLGHASDTVARAVESLDAVLLETNHDRTMLREGPYPQGLKRRVASEHLSNAKAARLVRDHAAPRLRAVLLGHVSAQNNDPRLAEHTMLEALSKRRDLDVALHATFRDRAAPAVEL